VLRAVGRYFLKVIAIRPAGAHTTFDLRRPSLKQSTDMSRIPFDQLHTFLTVVRLGGMRKAASGLSLTQPAVTARIKNLEEALCCELFDRTSSGMRLTKRGELLLAHAERFEYLAEQVERDVASPEGVEGRLRMGVSETIAQCWLPDLIARLHTLYPNLEIEFNVDISINLRASLLNRELDLAILLGPISDYSVDNVELPGFELAWYAAFSACFRLVEANLGVAALPRLLGQSFVEQQKIREFDPGWVPPPLSFTASFLGEPRSHLVERAAGLAREVALGYQDTVAK